MAAMMELKSLFVSIPALWRLTSGRQTPSQAVKPMVSSANAAPEAIRRQLLPIGSAVVPPPAAVATEPNRPIRKYLIFLKNFGAGEGIRTLDPNLGKFQTPSIRQHLFLSRSPLSTYSKTAFLAVAYPRGILFLLFETRFRASPCFPGRRWAFRGSRIRNSFVISKG